jgi:tetratricopeptide (TPR) repeat protein
MKGKILTSALLPEIVLVWLNCIMLLLPQGLYSQKSAAIDSFMNVIAQSKEDTAKVNTLVDLSDEFLKNKDVIQARKYVKEAKLLAEKLNFKPGMVRVYIMMGNLESSQKQDSIALAHFKHALQLASDIRHIDLMAQVNSRIGATYSRLYDYLTAIRYHMESRKLYTSFNKESGVAKANTQIGTNNWALGNYSQALK